MITLTSNQEIAEYVLENDGATVSLLAGRPSIMGPRDGDVYVVGGAVSRFGHTVPELQVHMEHFDADTVELALDYVQEHCRGMNTNWLAAGFWVEPGTDIVVIDAVDAIMGRELALSVARDRGERAVFHLASGETISTGV